MVRRGSIIPIFLFGALFAVAIIIGGNFLGFLEFSVPQNPLSDSRLGSRVLIAETSSDGSRCKNEGLQGVIGAIETINGIDYFTVVFDKAGEFEPYRPARAPYAVDSGCVQVFEE